LVSPPINRVCRAHEDVLDKNGEFSFQSNFFFSRSETVERNFSFFFSYQTVKIHSHCDKKKPEMTTKHLEEEDDDSSGDRTTYTRQRLIELGLSEEKAERYAGFDITKKIMLLLRDLPENGMGGWRQKDFDNIQEIMRLTKDLPEKGSVPEPAEEQATKQPLSKESEEDEEEAVPEPAEEQEATKEILENSEEETLPPLEEWVEIQPMCVVENEYLPVPVKEWVKFDNIHGTWPSHCKPIITRSGNCIGWGGGEKEIPKNSQDETFPHPEPAKEQAGKEILENSKEETFDDTWKTMTAEERKGYIREQGRLRLFPVGGEVTWFVAKKETVPEPAKEQATKQPLSKDEEEEERSAEDLACDKYRELYRIGTEAKGCAKEVMQERIDRFKMMLAEHEEEAGPTNEQRHEREAPLFEAMEETKEILDDLEGKEKQITKDYQEEAKEILEETKEILDDLEEQAKEPERLGKCLELLDDLKLLDTLKEKENGHLEKVRTKCDQIERKIWSLHANFHCENDAEEGKKILDELEEKYKKKREAAKQMEGHKKTLERLEGKCDQKKETIEMTEESKEILDDLEGKDNQNDPEPEKCYICERYKLEKRPGKPERGAQLHSGFYVYEKKDLKCECGIIPVHPSCVAKWDKVWKDKMGVFYSVCPRCLSTKPTKWVDLHPRSTIKASVECVKCCGPVIAIALIALFAIFFLTAIIVRTIPGGCKMDKPNGRSDVDVWLASMICGPPSLPTEPEAPEKPPLPTEPAEWFEGIEGLPVSKSSLIELTRDYILYIESLIHSMEEEEEAKKGLGAYRNSLLLVLGVLEQLVHTLGKEDLVKERWGVTSALPIIGKIVQDMQKRAREGHCESEFVIEEKDGMTCRELDRYFEVMGYTTKAPPDIDQALKWFFVDGYHWTCELEISWC